VDALGWRFDISGQLGTGWDLNFDLVFNAKSGELDFFASTGPQGGPNSGGAWTTGPLFVSDAPDNSGLVGPNVYGGGDAPVWVPDTPVVLNVEVEKSRNVGAGGPRTLYEGAAPVGAFNGVEAGMEYGGSVTWLRITLLHLY
jgi:hypothetical protein